MSAGVRVNPPASRAYPVACASSNTLQSRDRERAEAPCAGLLEATAQALMQVNDPRLD